MKSLADIAREQQAGRPTYFDDPEKDRLLALLIEVAEDVCVARDRHATARLLQERGEPATEAAIDAFEPDAEERARRLARHRAYYESLFARLGAAGDQSVD